MPKPELKFTSDDVAAVLHNMYLPVEITTSPEFLWLPDYCKDAPAVFKKILNWKAFHPPCGPQDLYCVTREIILTGNETKDIFVERVKAAARSMVACIAEQLSRSVNPC